MTDSHANVVKLKLVKCTMNYSGWRIYEKTAQKCILYLLYSMNVPPLNEVSWSWNSIKIKRRYYHTKTVLTLLSSHYIHWFWCARLSCVYDISGSGRLWSKRPS